MCVGWLTYLVINDFNRNDGDFELCSIGVHIQKNFAFFFGMQKQKWISGSTTKEK